MEIGSIGALERLARNQLSRRAILGACALGLGLTTAARSGSSRAVAQAPDAAALVQRFYEIVNSYQYEQAYALLGSAWQAQQSLAAFTKGYANTAFVQCETAATTQANAGTRIVRVQLVSWHNDAEIVAYEGSYTVGTEGGDLRILAGDNTPAAVPSGTPPLCLAGDMTFAFGPWNAGAGSRNGAIVGTNTGNVSCVAGGSPRVTLTDAQGNVVRSTSRDGSPPSGIVLEPGSSAQAPLRFADWCGDTTGPASVTVELPGGPATATVDAREYGISYPPCLGEDQAALLEITGWTAAVA